MIGASRLQEEDIVEIKKLLAMGVSQAAVARTYVPISGKKVSREHINLISSGKRWNPEIRSFSMKAEIKTPDPLEDIFALSPWSKYAQVYL
jgi:hypothetical protein